MNLISREELKEKLDRGDDFKLLMVLGEWEFRATHIPGSLNISAQQLIQTPGVSAMQPIDIADEVVVY